MNIGRRQMFPRKSLDGEDLLAFNPGRTVVTIERVSFKTGMSTGFDDAEIKYYLWVKEFTKPFKLNGASGNAVFDATNTLATGEWPGKLISIYPREITIPDAEKGQRRFWIVDVDWAAPKTLPSLAGKQDITGLAEQQKLGVRPTNLPAAPGAPQLVGKIGAGMAIELIDDMQQRGKTGEDFRAYLTTYQQQGMTAGLEPPDWPMSVVAWGRQFAASFPRVKAPMTPTQKARLQAQWSPPPTPPGQPLPPPSAGLNGMPPPPTEVVVRGTGEVIIAPPDAAPSSPPPVAPAPPPTPVNRPPEMPPDYDPINEEDIPF